MRACFCIGPKNGEPYCHCQMAAMRDEEHELHRLRRENRRLRDAAGSRRITDAGGIDCTMRASDRIGP